MNVFTSVAVFLYSAISLTVPSGFSIGSGLLVLGSVVLLKTRHRVKLIRDDRILIGVLLFYFAVSVGMNLLHHEIGKEYDLPLRFLLAVPALLLLRAYPPTPAFFWAGLPIGGIGAAIFAAWQKLVIEVDRSGGFTNPIQFGNISFIMGMLCFAGVAWAKDRPDARRWIVYLITGGFMALLGSLFTGSRGSWVGLPFCLLILYVCYGGELSKTYIWKIAAAVVLVMTMVFLIPGTEVRERANLAFQEAALYMKTKNAKTSIGTRMEMWRAGWLAASDSLFLGKGKGGFVKWESEQIDAGRIDPFMRDNNHVYNEWLDATAKRGLPGLLALLLLYIVPLKMFFSRVKTMAGRPGKVYAVSGVMLIVNYICFGFTQVALAHNTGVMTLAFTGVILWGFLRAEEDKELVT